MTSLPDSADHLSSSRLAGRLWAVGVLVSVAFVFITANSYDAGDSIQHYLYARSVPRHPLNLFSSWAKPLFTLLMAGPAQLGFRAVMLTQCALVAASAWLSFRVARGLELSLAALAVLFCYAAPDYFRIQFSGLTEPLFGLVLVGAVALAVGGRAGWSAALVSWLPFVRSEGFIMLGVWVVYLVWQRRWARLPGLLLGYAVYTVVGGLVLGEWGWVFGRNPYPTVSPYGHGDWMTFVVGLLFLLGIVPFALVLLGAGAQVARLLRRDAPWADPRFQAELLLVYGSIATFVGAHTVFWALGIFGSAGLTRVLTVLTPLLAVVAVRGLGLLVGLTSSAVARRRIVLATSSLTVLLLFTGLRVGFRWQRDFAQPGDVTLAEQAAAWYRQLPVGPRRPLVAEHPALVRALAIQVFDSVARLPNGKPRPHRIELDPLPVGALLFWDDWFSRVEGHLELQTIAADPRFRQRWAATAVRQPDDPGGGSCRVIVFEKIK